MVLVLLLETAPTVLQKLHPDRIIIESKMAHSAVIKLAAVFVPIVSAFATFWFRIGNTNNSSGYVPRDRWGPAIITSVVYVCLIVGFVFFAIYIVDYTSQENLPPGTDSFDEWIVNIMQLALLLSPIATAPAAWLLGVERIDPS